MSGEATPREGGSYQIEFYYDASKIGATLTRLGKQKQTLPLHSPEFTDEVTRRQALLKLLATLCAAIVSKEDPEMPLGPSEQASA